MSTTILSRVPTGIERSPMERFASAYTDLARRSRFKLQVTCGSSPQRFSVDVLGVLRSPKNLLISAPRTTGNSLIAITRGVTVTCRWLSPTTLYEFRTLVANLAFEPTPIVYLGDLYGAKQRTLRTLPRALTALSAVMRLPRPQAALVTDLSVGGAQVGVSCDVQLQVGQSLELAMRPRLLDRDFVLTLRCIVASTHGAQDAEHPLIHFYGLAFQTPPDLDLLILHGIVQARLAQEVDLLSQFLLDGATEDNRLD